MALHTTHKALQTYNKLVIGKSFYSNNIINLKFSKSRVGSSVRIKFEMSSETE